MNSDFRKVKYTYSIIIPLFNKGHLICRAINSVLTQDTDEEYEILVIDDGSTDDSISYALGYNDNRIKVFQKNNGGVSSARNYGMEKAQGEWLIFLDADDELLPGTLDIFSKMSNKYKNATLLVSGQKSKYSDRGIISQWYYGNNLSKISFIRFPYLAYWLRILFTSPGSMCIHRDIIDVNNINWNEKLAYYEDMDFVLRMMSYANIAITNFKTIEYHQEENGLSLGGHKPEQSLAFHIPEILKQKTSFWQRALLYENIEEEIYFWQIKGKNDVSDYFKDIQKTHFSSINKYLHWIRHQSIRHGIL